MSEEDGLAEVEVEIAGTVAIVGFPNVGKSTLVNRLSATRTAGVHETPGVTRDRKELLCEWAGTTFRLIDTGGVDRADTGPFGPQIAAQAREAVEEADVVVLVVDVKAGVTPGDEELAEILRRSRRDVLVVANKLDDPRRDLDALEFHRLGLGEPFPISALHGHGTGDLLDEVVRRLPGRAERPVGEEAIKVAILGRPNVGKSSLLNALLGRERVIVSEVPGTTRDSIDTVLQRGDTTFVLVDTADERAGRVDQLLPGRRQPPPFAVADAVGGDDHPVGHRQARPRHLRVHAKAAVVQAAEHFLVVNQLAHVSPRGADQIIRQLIHAVLGNARDIDAAIVDHIDRVLGLELLHHVTGEAEQAEHARMLGDEVEIL